MDQREKFEAWHSDKFRWISKRDDMFKEKYLDQRTQGLWEAWQASLSASAPVVDSGVNAQVVAALKDSLDILIQLKDQGFSVDIELSNAKSALAAAGVEVKP